MLIRNEVLLNTSILQDTQILVVDNDRDSRDLYALLLEGYGAKVIVVASIKEALGLLNGFFPNLLICEMRFLGESVYALIQAVRSLEFSCGRMIPIMVTSTCSVNSLMQQLRVKVDAYLLKPIEIDDLVTEAIRLSKVTYPTTTQDVVKRHPISNLSYCYATVT